FFCFCWQGFTCGRSLRGCFNFLRHPAAGSAARVSIWLLFSKKPTSLIGIIRAGKAIHQAACGVSLDHTSGAVFWLFSLLKTPPRATTQSGIKLLFTDIQIKTTIRGEA
ncbi:MAG: hypothetical protein AAGU05_17475, partial [Anaerolineaceae bacterium]